MNLHVAADVDTTFTWNCGCVCGPKLAWLVCRLSTTSFGAQRAGFPWVRPDGAADGSETALAGAVLALAGASVALAGALVALPPAAAAPEPPAAAAPEPAAIPEFS